MSMKHVKEIHDTREGRYLLMAIAALTTSNQITLNGRDYNGTQMAPDGVLRELTEIVNRVYEGHPAPSVTAPLIEQLRDDRHLPGSLYDTWKAQIAMCMYDAFIMHYHKILPNSSGEDLKRVCQDGADRFLKTLLKIL